MAVLYIGSSSSECGNCGKEAFPSEDGHYTIAGYYIATQPKRAGCGERWTGVSSNYAGMTKYMLAGQGFGYSNLSGLPVFDLGEEIGVYP